jgi:hypothetical protein
MSEPLWTAGTDWGLVAARLDARADLIAAAIPAIERAWDSPAGRANAEVAGDLVRRLRAVAEVARYNQYQLLHAAEADTEMRDEAYANAAARLTAPVLASGNSSLIGETAEVSANLLDSALDDPAGGADAVGAAAGLTEVIGVVAAPERGGPGRSPAAGPVARFPSSSGTTAVPPVLSAPRRRRDEYVDRRGHQISVEWTAPAPGVPVGHNRPG